MANIAIIVSDYNQEITKRMLETAEDAITKNNGKIHSITHVPGAFEIPLAVKQIIQKVDAFVALGAVIQGKTAHDLIIMEAIAPKLLDLSLEYDKPMGFGIIGPRASENDAKKRAEEYAQQAVRSVFSLLRIKNKNKK